MCRPLSIHASGRRSGWPRAKRRPLSIHASGEFAHAFAHFARGLIRERYGADRRGLDTAPQKAGNAVNNNTRLARTRARKHEQGALTVADAFFLKRV